MSTLDSANNQSWLWTPIWLRPKPKGFGPENSQSWCCLQSFAVTYRTPWPDSIKGRSDFSATIGVFPSTRDLVLKTGLAN
ncbi:MULTISPECIES: hypothetical protein [Pseudomonas]|uniref:Uncharacterized protein n=1 Tax=Pseudomonas emilianonis TaxID=2915812 RepID=A0ABT0EE63_9PSED|nr:MULTISPECIES: hypothetical protein [Pseudomonas]MCK1784003.1 hypothetical protein [Pseudomonas emilianonis]WET13091.1 hypothetical protein P3S72_13485 [Pseudomonas sp. D3]